LRTVAFHTLGCKLNFAETSTLERAFLKDGYEVVPFEETASVYVINTCSVTENADKECRKLVGSVHKKNPHSLICLIGCYAQLKPNEISSIPGVDIVLGASEKFNLLHFVNSFQKDNLPQVHACEVEAADTFIGSYSIGSRTRAFLKVQDGCDYTCSYCTIPLARGISRSDSMSNILQQVEKIVANGVKEIVLTGVNIGDFGKGENGNKKHWHTFLDLLQRLDQETEVERFRISSIEPNLLNDDIIRFVASSRAFVPHFHIPLQSGSDAVLKRMRRRYLTELFRNRIETIRSLMPDACIGVDVITGFPGETEQDFETTLNFLRELEVSYFHVFTYSERENTDAVKMLEVVPLSVRKKRNAILRNLSAKKMHYFYQSQLGKTFPVLWEGDNKEGMMTGFTPNYVKVASPYCAQKVNSISLVQLNKISPNWVEGFELNVEQSVSEKFEEISI
jgi:threonylcarbamoyladenosine tRNA methylthiotransferase MtaB